jgi:hypothetical protein
VSNGSFLAQTEHVRPQADRCDDRQLSDPVADRLSTDDLATDAGRPEEGFDVRVLDTDGDISHLERRASEKTSISCPPAYASAVASAHDEDEIG